MPRPSVAATALHKAPALPAPTGRRVPRPTATPPPRTTRAPRMPKAAKGLKGGKDDKDTDGDGEKRDASGLTRGRAQAAQGAESSRHRSPQPRKRAPVLRRPVRRFAVLYLSDRTGRPALRHRRRSLDRRQSGGRSRRDHREDGTGQPCGDVSRRTVAPGLQGRRRRPPHDGRGAARSRRRQARRNAGGRR